MSHLLKSKNSYTLTCYIYTVTRRSKSKLHLIGPQLLIRTYSYTYNIALIISYKRFFFSQHRDSGYQTSFSSL